MLLTRPSEFTPFCVGQRPKKGERSRGAQVRWGLQEIGGVLTAALTVRAAQPLIAAHGRLWD